MYPFERFTERAKKVLTLAQEEAERSHHSYIGTEHLVLGLIREDKGLAAIVLRNFGIDLATVRARIESVLGRNERIIIQQIVPTSRVKKVIEISFEEAQRMGHNYVGTEHLLLGLLIEGEGIAAHVLIDLGVTEARARAEIQRFLHEGVAEPTQRTAGSTAGPPPMQPELQQLMRRAQQAAADGGSSAFALEHVLESIVSTPAGTEILARLLDLRRLLAMKEQAIAAQEFETAARHREEEKRAREAFMKALEAWQAELNPPEAGS